MKKSIDRKHREFSELTVFFVPAVTAWKANYFQATASLRLMVLFYAAF